MAPKAMKRHAPTNVKGPRLVETLEQYGTELREILTADDVRTVATMVVRRAKMGELGAQAIVMRTAASLAIVEDAETVG